MICLLIPCAVFVPFALIVTPTHPVHLSQLDTPLSDRFVALLYFAVDYWDARVRSTRRLLTISSLLFRSLCSARLRL